MCCDAITSIQDDNKRYRIAFDELVSLVRNEEIAYIWDDFDIGATSFYICSRRRLVSIRNVNKGTCAWRNRNRNRMNYEMNETVECHACV